MKIIFSINKPLHVCKKKPLRSSGRIGKPDKLPAWVESMTTCRPSVLYRGCVSVHHWPVYCGGEKKLPSASFLFFSIIIRDGTRKEAARQS